MPSSSCETLVELGSSVAGKSVVVISASFGADVPLNPASSGPSVDVAMLASDDSGVNVVMSRMVVQSSASESVIPAVAFSTGACVDDGNGLLLLLLLLVITP